MNAKLTKTLMLTGLAALIAGCSGQNDDASKTDAVKPVVIYSNADEEAQVAIKKALDANGLKGAYLWQAFGTSELGGKLAAEGKAIEADVVTMTSYYLESLQQQQKMFATLTYAPKTVNPHPDFFLPILGNTGALFLNTDVLKKDNLPVPTKLEDLANPIYAGKISVPDILGSSTSWLMTQALVAAKGEKEGTAIVHAIEQNAGAHLEKSGSGPLKKLRAGEVAVGFGLRHQAVADKTRGLPIDYVDPIEGNYNYYEVAAVVDKGDKTNPNAQKVVEVMVKFARQELLNYYPVALYEGEKVDPVNQPKYLKTYGEPLTLELLKKHQKLVKGE